MEDYVFKLLEVGWKFLTDPEHAELRKYGFKLFKWVVQKKFSRRSKEQKKDR